MDGAEDAPPPAEAPADPPAEVATPPAEAAADEAPREAPAEAGDPPDAAGVAGGAPEDPSGAPPPAPAPASTAAVHIEIVEEHFGEPGGAAAGAEPGGAAAGAEAAGAPIERTATFGEGPLGLTMKRTAEEVVLVHSVQAGTQAAAQALEVGDRIVQLGDLDLRNAKVDKKFWAGAIEYVKAAPRPLALVVRPRETAAAAPPRDDPLARLAAAARGRSELAVRKLRWGDDFGADAADERAKLARYGLAIDGACALWRPPRPGFLGRALGPRSGFLDERHALLFRLRGAASDADVDGGNHVLCRRDSTLGGGVLIVAATAASATGSSSATRSADDRASDAAALPRGALDVEKVVALDACKLAARSACGAPREGGEASFDLRLGDGAVVTLAFPKPRARAWLAALGAAVVCPRAGLGPWRHGLLVGTALALAAAHAAGDDDDARRALDAALAAAGDLDARDASGATALHVASGRGVRGAVAALLDAGASVAARDGAGRTPLHAACERWRDGAAALLLADPAAAGLADARDAAGRTPLRAAADYAGNVDGDALGRLQRLVGGLGCWGASLEARDGDGLTAAHALAVRRKHEALDCLLRCGASAAAVLLAPPPPGGGAPPLRRGATALHCCFAGEAAELLAARGEGEPSGGDDPDRASRLALACDALLRHGCSATAADSAGRRAPEVALDAVTAGFAAPPLPRLARSSSSKESLGGRSGASSPSKSPTKKAPERGTSASPTPLSGRAPPASPALAAAVVSVCAAARADAVRGAAAGDAAAAGRVDDADALRRSCAAAARSAAAAAAGDGDGAAPSWAQLADALDRLDRGAPRDAGKPEATRAGKVAAWFGGLAGGRKKGEDDDRSRLFGAAEPPSPAPAPATPPSRAKKAAATSATAAADLEGLKQGFAERGEKLSRLSDKAEELNNAAEEFERMCTRLNRDAQRGGRWW